MNRSVNHSGRIMKVLITGGTGFIGRYLIKHLKHHAELTILSRNPIKAYRVLGHDVHCVDTFPEQATFDEFDAVINLAGEPIAEKRWTESQKELICQSRWQITQKIAEYIRQSPTPPVLISGSAIGYYGNQGEQLLDENCSCHSTSDFAHHVCAQWEEYANSVSDKTRVCVVRTGVVLSPFHGALKKLITPYKLGLGGPIGNGSQYMSWIHIEDMVRLLLFLLHNETVFGTFNATSPNPVTNKDFSTALAAGLHRPQLIHTPEFMLKMIFGEMASLMTEGQRVYPKKLLAAGFHFHHPEIHAAIENLLHRGHY